MSTETHGEVVHRPKLCAFTRGTTSELHAALRTVGRTDGARDPRAWLVIERHVRRVLPQDRDDDARQNALLAIVVHAHSLETSEMRGAHAWLHAVCRSQLVNELRTKCRLQLVTEDDVGMRSRALAPANPPPELAEMVLQRLDELIVCYVRTTTRDPNRRARKAAQARAAIRRVVLEETLPDVMAIAPAPPPLLTKWVERGRKVVLDALEAERAADPDMVDFFEPVAALMRKRRADAGRPRPARRKRAY